MNSLSDNIRGINEWTENANRRINIISSQLSEIETLLENKTPPSEINLIEILEFIDDIQEQHQSIKNIIACEKGKTINEMKHDLQNELEVLNQTFKLLKMETGS